MTSIRRRTAALVALSTTVLVVVGGVVMLIVLSRAMTAQFDEALAARAAALQSLTSFDGSKVEMDPAGEAMPRYARPTRPRADPEFFVAWVRVAGAWRVLARSESLNDAQWPPAAERDASPGTRDLTLPDGGAGRAALIEFSLWREQDEEGDHEDEHAVGAATTLVIDLAVQSDQMPVVRLLVAMPRAPLDRTLSIVGWCIAGVSAALALASIAASRWAVSRGLMPLGDLARRVRALGPATLDSRLESADLPAELLPIVVQLNALLARLEEAFEREKRWSAAASHELRTPIAELRMLLEVAASQPRTSEEWSGTASTGLDVLARAQSLCETLLRLSRAQSGHLAPGALERASIGPLLAEHAARVLSMHGGDARRVRIDTDAGLVVGVEGAALSLIIGNLLDNALRHGEPTSDDPVLVHASSSGGILRITITNPAPTLTDEDVTHLFEPFWRKDAARRDQNGFGLGLAVARTLARATGGEITARREARDGRSTLTLDITWPAP
jgi:signal transduction histidine kinase